MLHLRMQTTCKHVDQTPCYIQCLVSVSNLRQNPYSIVQMLPCTVRCIIALITYLIQVTVQKRTQNWLTPAQTIPNQRHPWSMALLSACVCVCVCVFLMTDTSRSSLGKRFNYQSRGLPITCAPHNLHGSTSLNRFPGHQIYWSNASEIPWPPLDDSYPTQLQGLKHLASIPTRGQQSFSYDQRGDIFYSRTRKKMIWSTSQWDVHTNLQVPWLSIV